MHVAGLHVDPGVQPLLQPGAEQQAARLGAGVEAVADGHVGGHALPPRQVLERLRQCSAPRPRAQPTQVGDLMRAARQRAHRRQLRAARRGDRVAPDSRLSAHGHADQHGSFEGRREFGLLQE